jgi:hypothetical protein
MDFDGTAKKSKLIIRFPTVKVVKEKLKNPDPRVCIIGGLIKIDTRRKTHQMKVMPRETRENNRRARTLRRL